MGSQFDTDVFLSYFAVNTLYLGIDVVFVFAIYTQAESCHKGCAGNLGLSSFSVDKN